MYAGRAGTGVPVRELARLSARLKPLAMDKMPLDVPPPVGAASARLIAGALWSDPYGDGFVAGFLRLVFQYHCTWLINSVAHTYGFRQYGSGGTARLSPWLAISTMGENSHERHHLAPEDYRAGVKWYHFDIAKWLIQLCSVLGLAFGLRSTPENAVLLRAERKASGAR